MKFFVFGGATSIDKMHRVPFVSWWPQEEPTYAEYNNGLMKLTTVHWDVDYVITHECPSSTYEEMEFAKYDFGQTQLQRYLEDIKSKLSYKGWYFGHYHEDHRYSNKCTVLYNTIEEVFKDGTHKISYP